MGKLHAGNISREYESAAFSFSFFICNMGLLQSSATLPMPTE